MLWNNRMPITRSVQDSWKFEALTGELYDSIHIEYRTVTVVLTSIGPASARAVGVDPSPKGVRRYHTRCVVCVMLFRSYALKQKMLNQNFGVNKRARFYSFFYVFETCWQTCSALNKNIPKCNMMGKFGGNTSPY